MLIVGKRIGDAGEARRERPEFRLRAISEHPFGVQMSRSLGL
jgi:hypothetical protein